MGQVSRFTFLGGVLEWHCLLLREHIKKNLRNDEYDLVIIGGGITGAGIALDASEKNESCIS